VLILTAGIVHYGQELPKAKTKFLWIEATPSRDAILRLTDTTRRSGTNWVHFSFGGRGGIIRENDRLGDENEYWSREDESVLDDTG
jgi:hypothetical protein